jgi:hypothetical protein
MIERGVRTKKEGAGPDKEILVELVDSGLHVT